MSAISVVPSVREPTGSERIAMRTPYRFASKMCFAGAIALVGLLASTIRTHADGPYIACEYNLITHVCPTNGSCAVNRICREEWEPYDPYYPQYGEYRCDCYVI